MTQHSLFPIESASTAIFSPCRSYRYTLWRRWSEGKNYVQFIGLNPSTADEVKDDNTIRKCISYSKSWGYDALCMTNLFAFRATDPKVMKSAAEPIGIDNDKYLLEIAKSAALIIAAWGVNGDHLDRDLAVKKLMKNDLFCIGLSNDGYPWHPLYKPGNLSPIPYCF